MYFILFLTLLFNFIGYTLALFFIETSMCSWEDWCRQDGINEKKMPFDVSLQSLDERKKEIRAIDKLTGKYGKDIASVTSDEKDTEVNGYKNRDFYNGIGR